MTYLIPYDNIMVYYTKTSFNFAKERGRNMYFIKTKGFIEGNNKLRVPQIEAYLKIVSHFKNFPKEEALVVLPTGSGKSGLISIAPFGVCESKVLVITPGNITKNSIAKNMEILEDNFWVRQEVIFDMHDLPNVLSYEPDVFDSDLNSANIIYSNIQKLVSSNKNSLINRVDKDFFDMIIVDEAHHSPADSWQDVINYFNKAKVLHVTGTPYRGDGKPVPGKLIHETKLSEVMEQKLVKWLRNKTLNSEELSFIDKDGTILSVEEARELHDDVWVQRSVAMSDECSLQVVKKSIEELNALKEISPKVPHKILAAACNINHAEKIFDLYNSKGMKPVLVHSNMDKNEIDKKLKEIDNHMYDVVINVDMMKEGYDHEYLTILAIYRPYKSLNAYAQVIGRVLRAIPEKEIVKHEIDNNAIVIYHKELNMDKLWEYFSKELEVSKRLRDIKELTFTDREFDERKVLYGDTIIEGETIEEIESYGDTIDFNLEFEKAKNILNSDLERKKEEYKKKGLTDKEIELLLKGIYEDTVKQNSSEWDKLYNEKRPAQRRKMLKSMLNKKVQVSAAEILNDANINEKGTELYSVFSNFLPIKEGMPNDGLICFYINLKLKKKFDKREILEIEDLQNEEKYLDDNIIPELRRMLNV